MRFNRTGKKNRVSYRIVLQEHTAAPGKRHVEILGSHDPHTKVTVLREDRITHWLKEGVQTSDAVHNLLVRKGVVTGDKRVKKMPRPEVKEPEVKEEELVAETPAEEAPVSTPQEEAAAESPTPEEAASEAEAIPEEVAKA